MIGIGMDEEHYPNVYLYRRIVQAKFFIEEHYSENINLNNIAEEAFFSKFHFVRLFKKIYGKTPHQYLIYIRIEKAKQLLKEDKLVSEVCFSVGFESLSSFSGLFKRLVGVKPLDFRIQQQHLKELLRETPLKFIPGCFASKYGWSENSNFGEVVLL